MMNTERLMKVLRWNIISNKREVRRTFTGLVIAYCVITAVNNMGNWLHHATSYGDTMSSAHLIAIATGFAMLLWASQVCFNMTTKTTFVNYAMLPATNIEKYIANVLYQTVCRIILVICALLATDILQAIMSLVMAGNVNSLTMVLLRDLGIYASFNEYIRAVILMFFVHSTFILGGTLFRHHQFLFTCLVWVVVPFSLSMLTAGAMAAVAYFLFDNGYDVSITPWFSESTYEVLITLAVIGIICFNYWLSYRFFRRSQVINNRFFN